MPHIAIAGRRIFYEENGQGIPILWLQGLGADHTAWSVQIARFSNRFRCIAPDFPDIGQSDPLSAGYTTTTLAADMIALMDALSLNEIHLVGLSMGGSVAQEMALRVPQRLLSLTLVSSFAQPDARQRELLESWADMYERLDRTLFYRQANLWLFAPAFFDDARKVSGVLHWVERQPFPQSAASFQRQIQAGLAHNTTDRLSGLSVPVLVIGGQQDILVLPEQQRTLASLLSHAHLRLIPAAAHSINLERQIIFNRIVGAFMDNPQVPPPDATIM